jgi:type II secretory pathway predicted ATPase ExeA
MLAARFGLGAEAARSKAVLLDSLERALIERRARGEITALVVDEAQSLSTELLEEIRLLANIETAREKLLPLVLAGQPGLAARLEDPTLRQLKQRVALRCEIGPLTLPETAAYVAGRISTAGGVPSHLFTRQSVALIHEYSGGIPRTISVICDNCLVSGMALDRRPVDREVVLEVCRDFALSGEAETAAGGTTAVQTELPESPVANQESLPAHDAQSDTDPGVADRTPQRRFTLLGLRRS